MKDNHQSHPFLYTEGKLLPLYNVYIDIDNIFFTE